MFFVGLISALVVDFFKDAVTGAVGVIAPPPNPALLVLLMRDNDADLTS